MNILAAGGAILLAGGITIVGVLVKMAVKEIRHPQREVQLPLPGAQVKDRHEELQHVG